MSEPLNNGITILASSASIIGKSIQATDIQIVNGLQTTESIFRFFSSGGKDPNNRCVLVKLFVTIDEEVRDSIIRATNNQTNVELASLHATDKIQRDIEDVLLRAGLFYERRKNLYLNLGHLPSEIITPLYLAAGYVALALRRPHNSATLKSKFMRNPISYAEVFSETTPLEVWPTISRILKRVDYELEKHRPKNIGTDNFLKGWRYIISLFIVAKEYQCFNYSIPQLAKFDTNTISSTLVSSIWQKLYHFSNTKSIKISSTWSSNHNVVRACKEFSQKYNITGIEILSPPEIIKKKKTPKKKQPNMVTIPAELIDKIKSVLPPQPWKPGIHNEIASTVGCTRDEFFRAVKFLIQNGIYYRQKDGVLYDNEGKAMSFDHERVDPYTLKLKNQDK